MSAAEDDSDGLDLQRVESSDEHQDAQIDRYQSLQSSQDLQFSHSEGSISQISSTQGEAGRASNELAQIAGPSQTRNPCLVLSLEHNPFAEEPSFFTRPNRYFGPDSTWLSWTKEERLVAEALDTCRSQDLSIHLFNAYALKRKGQAVASQQKKQRKGKKRARSVDNVESSEEVDPSSFIPPSSWTAWPLPPAQVPREEEAANIDDRDTCKMPADSRPSAVLEDSLIATTTRIAREMWRSRQWESDPIDKQDLKNAVNQDVEMTLPEDTAAIDIDAADTLQTDSQSEPEMFQSKRWDLESKDDSLVDPTDIIGDKDGRANDRRPTPIADDDEARALILPGTRHILSKLDGLLMGLHHARQAYATTTYTSSRKKKRNYNGSSPFSDQATDHESRQKKRKRSASTVASATDIDSKTEDSEARHSRRTQLQLNPRDWSDIIGMAALTGWDSAVVQRAGERCANLFGENMMFRTFFEGDAPTKEPPSFEEHYAVSKEEASEADDAPSTQENDAVPVRTSAACQTCYEFKHKCEPCIPSEADAAFRSEHSGPCERCALTNQAAGCSGIKFAFQNKSALLPSTAASRRCPHKSCSRHKLPFKSSWLLDRHLTEYHKGNDYPSSPTHPSSSGVEYLSSSQTIICPVITCPRHEKGFSRGQLLYNHIKNRHPEVDVEEVKKLESKRRGGNGRGRWTDERRHRPWSKSRSRSRSRAVGEQSEGDEDESSEDSGEGSSPGKKPEGRETERGD